MLQVKKFTTEKYKENTFVIYDETNECMLVDCGSLSDDENKSIELFIEQEKLTVKHIVCTHCHLDHTMGVAHMSKKYGVEPEVNPLEQPLVEMSSYQALALGIDEDLIQEYTPKYDLEDGSLIKFGNSEFEVIHTPGHSPGGICLYSAQSDILISGDTLMRHAVGATNLPGGRQKKLQKSIDRLFELPDSTIIYPGHGENTTIGEEKNYGVLNTAGSVRES